MIETGGAGRWKGCHRIVLRQHVLPEARGDLKQGQAKGQDGQFHAAYGVEGRSELAGWTPESMVRRYADMSVKHLEPFADRLDFDLGAAAGG